MATEAGKILPARGKFFLTKNAFGMDWEMDIKTAAQGQKAAPGAYKMTILQEISATGLTPEQERARKEALEKMTPEQRRQQEEMKKKRYDGTPSPRRPKRSVSASGADFATSSSSRDTERSSRLSHQAPRPAFGEPRRLPKSPGG